MKIIKVTPDNINSFNKEIKKPNLIAFVKIYSNSCGHCKAMESDWTQLENELKNEDINGLLASISSEDIESADCDTDNRGVPTLRVFEGGKRKMDYEGKRETADMKLFFKNLLKPKQKGGRRKNFLKKSSRKQKKRKTRRRKNFLKKSSRKKRKTRRRKNFLKKSSRKKRKTRKRRRKRGGLTKAGKLKSDAMIASGMLRGEDDEFRRDSIGLLQDIRSLDDEEEEEGLNLKDLKLMGGRRKTKKRKKRRK
jgi:thiol-disulfide isomerase/thioredoxin